MFDNPMFGKMIMGAIENNPQLLKAAQDISSITAYVRNALQRIERKQDQILDDLNDQRRTSDLPVIEFTRTPE